MAQEVNPPVEPTTDNQSTAPAPVANTTPAPADQGEQIPVTVNNSDAPAAPAPEAPAEAESASEDASEGNETTEAPAEAPVEAPAPVATPQPVAVKNALSSLHSDLSAVVSKLKGSEVAAAHDIEDLLGLLESAKTWVAEKVAVLDPALGKELGAEPTEPQA